MKSPMSLAWPAFLILLLHGPAAAAPLTVVELFQSQGCSSCPPANANVMAISTRSDILTLSFGVTYWDYLGWKDTFASPAYTSRQWDYAHAFRHSEVYTPQVVINGTRDLVGQDRDELERAIRDTPAPAGAPEISLTETTAIIGSGSAAKANVWLVRYDPDIVQVPIARGENSGTTIPHKNVVHELVRIGTWSGARQTYALPPATRSQYRTAILVQDGAGGPIIAAGHS